MWQKGLHAVLECVVIHASFALICGRLQIQESRTNFELQSNFVVGKKRREGSSSQSRINGECIVLHAPRGAIEFRGVGS